MTMNKTDFQVVKDGMMTIRFTINTHVTLCGFTPGFWLGPCW